MAKKKTSENVTSAPSGSGVAAATDVVRQSSHGSAAPDLRAELEALKAENARLRAGQAEPEHEIQRYPCVMYKKHKVDEKHPNAYERRRIELTDDKGNLDAEKCDAEVARLEKAGWVHSPADIAA